MDVIAIGRMVCGVVFGVALLYVLWLLLLMGHAIVTDDEMQSGAEVQSGAGQGGAPSTHASCAQLNMSRAKSSVGEGEQVPPSPFISHHLPPPPTISLCACSVREGEQVPLCCGSARASIDLVTIS